MGIFAGNSALLFHRTSEKPRRRLAAVLSAAALLSLVLSAMPGNPARADVVVNNISVGEGASNIVVNPVTNTVYVTTNDGLTIINGTTQATAKVKTGGVPADLTLNIATNKIYVSNKGGEASGTVAVIDGSTHAVTQVSVGPDPYAIAVNQTTNKIYVGGRAGLSVIDGKTNASTTINTDWVTQVAINQATNRVYVLANGVKVINGATNSVTQIDMGYSVAWPTNLAVNQVTNKVYIASRVRNYMELEVLDGASNQVQPIYSDLNSSPAGLTVDETNNRVYLGRILLGDGTLSSLTGVLSVFGGEGGGPIDIRTGETPEKIAVNGKTNRVYLGGNYLGVKVIDGTIFALSTLFVKSGTAIAVNETTNRIYVAKWAGTVAVIDGSIPSQLKNDFSGDWKTDVLARDTSGLLWLYPGNGAAGWQPRTQVGSAWNSMTAVVSPGDFSGDTKPDVLARDGAGHLWMYPGNGSGGWLPRVHVGSGWNAISAIVTPGDFNGDGTSDILARDTSGILWLYPGNGRGDWLPRTNLGAGWNALTAIVGPGDFDSNGTSDVLARDGSGLLWLYSGDGMGGWWGNRKQVGQGWNPMTAIVAPGDFNGDGRPDIMARDSSGALFLYPSASGGAWLPTVRIGQGWNSMTAIL